MDFLGFLATTKGLKLDPKKVKTIMSWETLKTVKNVQCFLGFVNSYQIFIKNYSQIVVPLTQFTSKDKLEWGPLPEKTLQNLKMAFITTLILVHLDFTKAFCLAADASNFALGAVHSQMGVDEKLHPVVFYSKNSLLLRSTIKDFLP